MTSEPELNTLSIQVPRFLAASRPAPRPTIRKTTREPTVSETVSGKRSRIVSQTFWLLAKETPKQGAAQWPTAKSRPAKMPIRKFQYWTVTGLSRPRFLWMISSASGVQFLPQASMAGSCGIAKNMKKVKALINTRISTAPKDRRMRN